MLVPPILILPISVTVSWAAPSPVPIDTTHAAYKVCLLGERLAWLQFRMEMPSGYR